MAFLWGRNCIQAFWEQRSHWSSIAFSEILWEIIKMPGKFHACLLWVYFPWILPNEQYYFYSRGHYRCSTFPDIHSFLFMKWNPRLLHSQRTLHRQELSTASLGLVLFFFFLSECTRHIRNNYIGINFFYMIYLKIWHYSFYLKCPLKWERKNPLQSLCRLFSIVLALLYFPQWWSQGCVKHSGKFLPKIQLSDKKRRPLVKCIYCHLLSGRRRGNCPGMQWIRVHYTVKTLDKVPEELLWSLQVFATSVMF